MTHSVFIEAILQNREICPICYRRYRETVPAPDDEYWNEHAFRTKNGVSTHTLQGITTERTVGPTDDGCESYPGPVIDSQDQSRRAKGGRRIVCYACGEIDGDGNGDAKSTSDLVQDLDRICDRLAEQDIQIDDDTAFSHLRHEAAKPDRQHAQQEILEESVRVGCQTAELLQNTNSTE